MGGSNGTGPVLTLASLVDEVVGGLEAVDRHSGGRATVFERAGTPFAAIDGEALEVRLDPVVAVAALRTPDTDASTRGPAWVRFDPPELDRMAIDRATAWLEYAWRHALD
jgi:hypothetical protein